MEGSSSAHMHRIVQDENESNKELAGNLPLKKRKLSSRKELKEQPVTKARKTTAELTIRQHRPTLSKQPAAEFGGGETVLN